MCDSIGWETERLIMRHWQESDLAPFAVLNADRETMRFFPDTLNRTASNVLIDMIETRFDRQGFGFWALVLAPRVVARLVTWRLVTWRYAMLGSWAQGGAGTR